MSEGRLVFSVEKPFDEIFSVTSEGNLVTVAELDREQDAAYSFRVTVTDDGQLPGMDQDGLDVVSFTSTCLVEVSVEDVNDEAPAFERADLYASVAENAPPGTPFSRVFARDGDEGRNAEVHYLLEDSHGMRFSVGRIDGVLRSEAPLDREKQKTYELTVLAMDNGSPR